MERKGAGREGRAHDNQEKVNTQVREFDRGLLRHHPRTIVTWRLRKLSWLTAEALEGPFLSKIPLLLVLSIQLLKHSSEARQSAIF